MGFLRRLLGTPAVAVAALMVTPEREDAALDIVGEGSYQRALERVAGGRNEDGPMNPEHVAVLWPEPNNRYDQNAIAVKIDGLTVGYLAREDAVLYGPVVRIAEATNRKITVESILIGGWDRGRDDRGYIRVRLHMGSPAETLLDVLGDTVVVRTDHPWPSHLVAFTGDSRYVLSGVPLDRDACILLARRAGLDVHPRITKSVQLLIDCDPDTASGNERKAVDYGIPVVAELEFWQALGVDARPRSWRL